MADLVWQQRLRPFLNHPGVRPSDSFYKPTNPVHRPSSQQSLGKCEPVRLLRPFTHQDWEADRRSTPSSPAPTADDKRPLRAVRASPQRRQAEPSRSVVWAEEEFSYQGTSSSSTEELRQQMHRQAEEYQDSVADGDPSQIRFSEEPDDHRVRVPAHRIGDAPEPAPASVHRSPPHPKRSSPRSNRQCADVQPSRTPGVLGGSSIVTGRFGRLLAGVAQKHPRPLRSSRSSPQLFLAAKQISIHKPYGGGKSSPRLEQGPSSWGISAQEQAALAGLFDDQGDFGDLQALLER